MINGILNINKPKGKTSYEIVAWLKHKSGERKIGHAGILDWGASGVLPVCLGKATKIVQFLMNFSKIYQAEIKLGITTDTYDIYGKIIAQHPLSDITREKIEQNLSSFQGLINQTPPPYSALKIRGKRSSDLVRAGLSPIPKPRQVVIYSITLIDWSPPLLNIIVECGKGTYIRSLAHQLGQILGCGACLNNLIRLKYGPFEIRGSLSLIEMEKAFKDNSWNKLLQPLDIIFLDWPLIIVDEKQESKIKNGQPLFLNEKSSPSEYSRAYNKKGEFIAILRFVSDLKKWQPIKVFNP